MKLPHPLDQKYILTGKIPLRILSDTGIRQALELGLIRITPSFDAAIDTKRIQPATLDVKIQDIDEIDPIDDTNSEHTFCLPRENLVIPAKSVATINLTELIDFGQLVHRDAPRFFGIMTEARSSTRRLGMYMANSGQYFFSGPTNTTLEIGNFSPNDLLFTEGERVAQLFFTVQPFADKHEHITFADYNPDVGETVRSLDMGIEITSTAQLRLLEKKGYLKISPALKCKKGRLIVHASSGAYRMRKLDEKIDFSRRDDYSKETILEPIDISKGYQVRPFEHLIIEALEQMELSAHVGILFWDNLFLEVFSN